ncbi:MAG: ABC transporter ATP-binding protein [Acidobacteriota bacterium]|nr:ABC transporter ATP-binding protein [Acidobacteriota bacterium]
MIELSVTRRYPPGPDSAGFNLDMRFEAAPGITVLYGASGAGKTLTLECIAGFATPDTGRILLDDRILFDAQAKVNLKPRQRGCGYVFQNYALFPHMTLRQNLAFAAHALPRLERHRRIAELLERFRLTDLAGRYPRELSGGQKQRGSIARALIAQPNALLLDEPARGLDTSLRADLRDIVLEIRQSLKTPVLLVTHDLEECLAVADSVLIVDAGQVIHCGAPLDLLRNPGTPAVARLLGDFNIYEAEVLALDPARQSSRIRLLGQEMDGPHLRGCFKGDRVSLCIRPEELRLAAKPGDNRIRVSQPSRVIERPQSIRADFGNDLVIDVPRDIWSVRPGDGWVELPAVSLRQLLRK